MAPRPAAERWCTMQRFDFDSIRELVATQLPPSYEPLKLTFYGRGARPNGDDLVIGDDDGTEIRVLGGDGGVYSVDPQHRLPTRFMNSSVEHLSSFLELIHSYHGRGKEECDARMWPELAALDPPAFADPENWWTLVHEQVQQGLL
jgi:hypothetical protein